MNTHTRERTKQVKGCYSKDFILSCVENKIVRGRPMIIYIHFGFNQK
jgi:hypothetical protein